MWRNPSFLRGNPAKHTYGIAVTRVWGRGNPPSRRERRKEKKRRLGQVDCSLLVGWLRLFCFGCLASLLHTLECFGCTYTALQDEREELYSLNLSNTLALFLHAGKSHLLRIFLWFFLHLTSFVLSSTLRSSSSPCMRWGVYTPATLVVLLELEKRSSLKSWISMDLLGGRDGFFLLLLLGVFLFLSTKKERGGVNQVNLLAACLSS